MQDAALRVENMAKINKELEFKVEKLHKHIEDVRKEEGLK